MAPYPQEPQAPSYPSESGDGCAGPGQGILEAFRDHLLTEKKSRYTIRQYLFHVKNFLEWSKKTAEELDIEQLESYRRYLSVDRRYSKNSLYVATIALRTFFKFLGKNIEDKIKPPRRGLPIPKYLTEDEMSCLLAAAHGDKRDTAILLTLGYSGLRVGELCALDVEDIDFSEGVINVRSGKGDKGRIALIDEKTIKALKDYLDSRAVSTGPLFISARGKRITERRVEKLVKKYAMLAGIKKTVTPHVLRHTFATALLKRGADIRIIQQLLGHASVATTQIYTHIDDRALKEAYKKAKPEY
ncbi:MAG: tyrosine-type recombinase/integrase [Thermoplasmata archaeon]